MGSSAYGSIFSSELMPSAYLKVMHGLDSGSVEVDLDLSRRQLITHSQANHSHTQETAMAPGWSLAGLH